MCCGRLLQNLEVRVMKELYVYSDVYRIITYTHYTSEFAFILIIVDCIPTNQPRQKFVLLRKLDLPIKFKDKS